MRFAAGGAATAQDVPALVRDIAAWQTALWQTFKVGSYTRPEGAGYAVNLTRQQPVTPPAVESVPVRLAVKPAPGQADVVLHLATRDVAPSPLPLSPAGERGRGEGGGKHVIWQRPRFEGPGKPTLLLRDYADVDPAFEVDYPSAFAGTARYLAAVVEAANDPKIAPNALAKKHGLDAAFLQRWIDVLAIEPRRKNATVPAVPLHLLEEKSADKQHPAVRGWRKKGPTCRWS